MSDQAGKPYQPSNGTEGVAFTEIYCDNCRYETIERQCSILTASLVNDIDDPDYPKQWIYNKKGYPTCTAFSEPYDMPATLRHDGACDDPNQMRLF